MSDPIPLSEESLETLRFFKSSLGEVPEDSIPRFIPLDRVKLLESQRLLLSFPLLLPGQEEAYPRGLIAYKITPLGLDALSAEEQRRAERAEQERKAALKQHAEERRRREDVRRTWIQWTITTLLTVLSFFAGALTEILTGFMQRLISSF